MPTPTKAKALDRELKRAAKRRGFEVPAWAQRAGLASAYVAHGLNHDEFAAASLCRLLLKQKRRAAKS